MAIWMSVRRWRLILAFLIEFFLLTSLSMKRTEAADDADLDLPNVTSETERMEAPFAGYFTCGTIIVSKRALARTKRM